MRSPRDRIRHAVSFEVIGLLLATPLGAWVFHLPAQHVGVVTVVSAVAALGWNYVYNWGFDRVLQATRGTTQKSLPLRVLHAIMFELGLLALLLPFISLYLGIGPLEALLMDLAFAGFYMVYAFFFNLAYDRLFPLPEWQKAGAGAR